MLEIRPVGRGDAAALLEILSDPEVAVWLRGAGEARPFDWAECEAIIVQKVAHLDRPRVRDVACVPRPRCVERAIAQHNRVAGRSEVEIGWAVSRERWGQGIATELGHHALDWVIDAGFVRVVAFTRPDNLASRRVMDKLGLRYEREIDLPHSDNGGRTERMTLITRHPAHPLRVLEHRLRRGSVASSAMDVRSWIACRCCLRSRWATRPTACAVPCVRMSRPSLT